MDVVDAVTAITEECPEALLVSSLGTATAAVRQVTEDGPHFYFGAAMGCALAGALGFAEALPDRRVIAVLGDGDFLMGANTIWSLAACGPANLTAVVLADGAYSITGGQSLATRLQLAGVADALDGVHGSQAGSAPELRGALRELGRPGVIETRIDSRTKPEPSPFVDPTAVVHHVRAHLAGLR